MANIILIGIFTILLMLYFKLDKIKKIKTFGDENSTDDNLDFKKDNDLLEDKIIEEKFSIKLIKFNTQMSRWSGFLNQSKYINKFDILSNVFYLEREEDSVEDWKIFFIETFTKLLLKNGYSISDMLIDGTVYGRVPSKVNYIWFDIQNEVIVKDEWNLKVRNADVFFRLKGHTDIILKWEFYNDNLEKFREYFNKFIFTDLESNESYKYNDCFVKKAEFRIVLNDLVQYAEFIGKNFLNMTFTEKPYNFDYTSIFNKSEYVDKNWQIDKGKLFSYQNLTNKNKNIKELDREIFYEYKSLNIKDLTERLSNETNEEIFAYCYNKYFDGWYDYNEPSIIETTFTIVEQLDILIERKFPLAFIFKSLLHLDGKIVLKDISEAKRLLKEAYSLGLQTPSMMIWNENNLD